jgi:hypothetical protein
MAVEIGALRALLSLDSAAFESGVKRAQGSTKRLSDTMKQVAKVAATAFAAVTAAAIAGARDIDQVAKASRRIGSSIGGFEALKLAAGEAGVPLSSLPDELQNINREIANIGTSGNADRALERLGLEASDLANLDADEKIARIADRVRELGLSSGEATALLRDLGVRNREMVLLLQQGGGAIRAARVDVEDYGLALSGPVVAAIEQANDRIGRLSIVARVFGQQLATAVVPTLGRFSEAITDSLREGGLLRDAIDVITSSIRGLVVVVEAVVDGLRLLADWMGNRVVVAVGLISAALVILRRNMIRTGIGALIVAAGALVDFLDRLKTATGSWGEALVALGGVGKSVFLGMGNTARGLFEILAGVASAIAGSFVRAFAEIARSWDALVNGMAAAWNAIADTSFGEALGFGKLGRSDISGTLGNLADGLFDQAIESINTGGQRIKDAGKGVSEAIANLRETLNSGGDASSAAADAARELASELDDLGGNGGGKASAAAKNVDGLSVATNEMSDTFKRAFANVVSGATSATDALNQMLQSLLNILAQDLAGSIFDKLGGSGIIDGITSGISGLFGPGQTTGTGLTVNTPNLLPPMFDSGGFIRAGQFGIVGERGPEIVTGPANVTSRVDTAKMLGGGKVVNNITVNAPPGSDVQEQRRQNSTGGEDLTIIIDRAVSNLARDPGSALSRTLGQNFGLRPATRGR